MVSRSKAIYTTEYFRYNLTTVSCGTYLKLARNMKHYRKLKSSFHERLISHIKFGFSISAFHGMNHVVAPKRHILERILWIGIIAAALTFGLSKSYGIYTHYQTRPSVVNVELNTNEWLAEFPSVTICQSKLKEEDLKKIFKKKMIEFNATTMAYMDVLRQMHTLDYNAIEKYLLTYKEEFLQPKDYADVLLEVTYTINEQGTFFPLEQTRPVLPIFTEVGICGVINPYVGIYYTPGYFNSSMLYRKKFEPILYNMTTETSMSLRVNKNIMGEYNLYVHSPNDVVNYESKNITGYIAKATTVKVNTINVHTNDAVRKLSVGQRYCKLNSETTGLKHSPVYSYSMCRTDCRIQICYTRCRCTPYYYRRSNEPICNLQGMLCIAKLDVLLKTLQDPQTNKTMCNCIQDCDSSLIIIDQVQSKAWFQDTLLTVQIDTLTQPRYVRKLLFSKMDILVQQGGIFGLCLGCSILSIIEIVYFTTLRFFWGAIKKMSIKTSL